MATGWTQRLASAPHALAIAGTVLAAAALGQVVAQALITAVRSGQTAPGSTAGEAVSLCLLALATTVPLIFLRPAAAAATITAASTVSLAVFGVLTVAGLAAQVLASYRLGREGVPGTAGWPGATGGTALPSWPVGWPYPSSCSRSTVAAEYRPSCWPCLSRRRPGPGSPSGHAARLRGRPPPVR